MTPSVPHSVPQRLHRIGRLPRGQRRTTYAIFVFCAFSGLLFFMAHDAQLNLTGLDTHSLLMAHGISAQCALLAMGAVMPAHIRLAWNARRNRGTGVLLCTVLGVLMASGLWLYYGSEELRSAAVWSHWVFGGLGFGVFPLHALRGPRAVPTLHALPSSPRAQNTAVN